MALTQISTGMLASGDGTVDLNIDNGTFVVDVSTSRVGIGTSSPRSILDLDGGSETQLRLQTTNSGSTTSDGLLVSLDSSANAKAYIWNYENAEMIFGTNDTERMRIDSSGNVQVGTGTPAYLVGTGDIAQLSVNRVGTSGAITNTARSAAFINVNGANGGSSIEFATASANNTQPAERMRIDASGNVKIGDSATDITSKLVVSGNADANVATFMYDGSAGTFLDFDLGAANGDVTLAADARSGAYPPLVFKTSNTERMRIDSSGNVSIGNVTSSTPLTSGSQYKIKMGQQYWNSAKGTDSSIKLELYSTGASDTYGLGLSISELEIQSQADIGFYAGGGSTRTKRMHIESSNGNVGIGTDSPSTKLTVRNDSASTSFGDNNIITIRNANTTDNSRMGLAFTGNTNIGSGLALVEAQSYDQSAGHTSLNFSVYSGSWHNDMMVLKAGNVGIGTAIPIATLHVDPAANVTTGFGTPLIKVGGDNSWAGNGSLYSVGFGYVDSGVSGKSPAEIGLVTTSSTGHTLGDLVFATREVTSSTAPTERMRIASDGIVVHNGVSTYSSSVSMMNNVAYSFDIPVGDEGGAGNVIEVHAMYDHYFNFAYGASLITLVGKRGTNVSRSDIKVITTTNGGAWSITAPNSSTLRLTKSAGSYGGAGFGHIMVRFRKS